MQGGFVLMALGVLLVAAGLWVATTPALFINAGNQCGANGCRNVSATVPFSAPGAIVLVIGLLVSAYGWTRRKGNED